MPESVLKKRKLVEKRQAERLAALQLTKKVLSLFVYY